MITQRETLAFSFPFFTGTSSDFAQICLEPIPPGSGTRLVVTANVDHIVTLHKDREFRYAYQFAWQRTIDGAPLYAYLRVRRKQIKERTTGADLFAQIMLNLDESQHHPFFVCSSEETARRLTKYCREQLGYDGSSIGTCVPPFGFDSDAEYSRRLLEEISNNDTTHLFLGVGAPKSEIWGYRYAQQLGDRYVFCFGAGLDYFAGTKGRAPLLLRRTGFEWLWRVACEPKRLFKRYFVDSWTFLVIAAKDWASAGKPFSND